MIEAETPDVLTSQFVGIGLERVSMAMGKHVESPDAVKQKAVIALEEEAKQRNVQLPPAYEKLKLF